MKTLPLKDLEVGKVDAKHEWLNDLRFGTNFLIDSFVVPETVNVRDFLIGKKYFITGLKGTGKTALLRYLTTTIQNNPENKTSFVLFKTEVSEEERKQFSRVSSLTIVDETKDIANQKDYESIWRWYFYRKIVDHIEQNPISGFKDNKAVKKFITAVKAPYLDKPIKSYHRFIPKLQKGTFKVSGGAKALATELGINFEWEDKDHSVIKFPSLVAVVDDLYSKLEPGNNKFYIFVDELELSYGSKKQFERDCRIIRDLIVSIGKLNSISAVQNYKVHIIAALRSEVLSAVASLGKEINKITTDYGIPLFWHRGGINLTTQPLLNVILKKLEASERMKFFYFDKGNIWNRYFPKTVHSQDTRVYLLHSSWYRPRDFVRLLGIAKNQNPKAKIFSQAVLDDARRNYSKESWVEIAEELQPAYTREQIQGIKRIFTAFKQRFTFDDLMKHIKDKQKAYKSVQLLLENKDISQILEDLYRTGVIGNHYPEKKPGRKRHVNRWAFRGDDQILIEKRMAIHAGLVPAFSLT